MRIASIVTLISVALFPALASAQAVRVVQVRSAEDPNSPPDPAVCAEAPFAVNVRLGGTLYAYTATGNDGTVVVQSSRPVGRATACAQITSLAFPAGLAQKFYIRLTLPDGDYTASGTCTIVSNDMPAHGLVLAGCNLAVKSAPAGVIGGAVTSLTTFNPFRLVGFTTGSYYTLQLYDAAPADDRARDSDRAMEWIDSGDEP